MMFKPSPFKILTNLFLTILFLSFNNPYSSCQSQLAGSGIFQKKKFQTETVIRGERLFYGLVYFDDKSINCAGCHNTNFSDSLNWNPDAVEISKKYLSKSAGDLSKVLLSPSGTKMSTAHKNFNLSPEDIALIKAYMDKLPEIDLKQKKPVLTNLILFILASLLFLFSIIDLFVTKKIKNPWISIILLLSIVYITYTLVVDAIAIGHSPGYEPDQPIKFSHAVHAGQNHTDCIYCHSYAPYSKTAGFPAENICMNCHLLVRTGKRSGAFEIAKIISAYENKIPVEWIKVYNLPDHVFFSHAQHVSAGGINCQECHGTVKNMGRIRLNQDLTMGWCINCHRKKNINFNNNRFYSEYVDLKKKIRNREADSVTVKMIGGTECMKCHY